MAEKIKNWATEMGQVIIPFSIFFTTLVLTSLVIFLERNNEE